MCEFKSRLPHHHRISVGTDGVSPLGKAPVFDTGIPLVRNPCKFSAIFLRLRSPRRYCRQAVATGF
ncbi:hypothetical protein KCP73_04040 [Salmonella enterica subsp. enterica]|nr:hypothetical protein KCP73_04040 [Salmonella enterica subsp. enterica]